MMSKPTGAFFGVLTLVVILAIAPSAFAESDTTVNIPAGAGSGPTCSQSNNCFDPNVINVTPGTTVEWKNNDKVGHTVTSGNPSDNETGTIFDSSLIAVGKDYSFTFNDPGTYNYFCQIHPWMTGQVIVAAASAPSTTSNNMQGMSSSSGSNMSSGTLSNTPETSVPSSTTESTNMPSSTTTSSAPPSTEQSSNNAAPSTPTPTSVTYTSTSTTSSASPDQMAGWSAGIGIAAVMSGIGVWSAVRRR